MIHYTFAKRFRSLYDKAVTTYRGGRRGAGSFFSTDEEAWLKANGLTPQYLYDYAEDEVNDGEPGYDEALSIELLRRDYFFDEQKGILSTQVLDETSLPPKSATARGIEWLPRILPKARAKLRGELPANLMYCCGGDRHFFHTHDIHPHEFLNLIWRAGNNDEMVFEWVAQRAAASKTRT